MNTSNLRLLAGFIAAREGPVNYHLDNCVIGWYGKFTDDPFATSEMLRDFLDCTEQERLIICFLWPESTTINTDDPVNFFRPDVRDWLLANFARWIDGEVVAWSEPKFTKDRRHVFA